MKKALVIISYSNEAELNTLLSHNPTEATVSAIYEDLDAADIEHIEDVIERDILAPDEEGGGEQ